jgi:hypothetical protein
VKGENGIVNHHDTSPLQFGAQQSYPLMNAELTLEQSGSVHSRLWPHRGT